MSGSTRSEQLHRVGAVLGDRDVVAARDEVRADQVDDVLVVLDEQDPGAIRRHRAPAGRGRPRSARSTGVDGRPGRRPAVDRERHHERRAVRRPASSPSRPPCASTMPLAIDRPKPAPATSVAPRNRGWKIRLGERGRDARTVVPDLHLDGAGDTRRGEASTSTPPSDARGTTRSPAGSRTPARGGRGRPRSARAGRRTCSAIPCVLRARSRPPPRDQPEIAPVVAAAAGCRTRWRWSRAGRRPAAPSAPTRRRSSRRNRSVDSASHVRSGWRSVEA